MNQLNSLIFRFFSVVKDVLFSFRKVHLRMRVKKRRQTRNKFLRRQIWLGIDVLQMVYIRRTEDIRLIFDRRRNTYSYVYFMSDNRIG